MARCAWKQCDEWSNKGRMCVYYPAPHTGFCSWNWRWWDKLFFPPLVENSCHCCFLFCTVIINPLHTLRLTSFSSFNAEPVQSCQSTAVLQIPGSDPWKERWVFLSPVSYRVLYWPCLLKPNPSHASKLSTISACSVVCLPNMQSISLHSICVTGEVVLGIHTNMISVDNTNPGTNCKYMPVSQHHSVTLDSYLNNNHITLAVLSAWLC